ncbi:MAG: hypothetical protein ACK5TA_01205, partial [bacterium]
RAGASKLAPQALDCWDHSQLSRHAAITVANGNNRFLRPPQLSRKLRITAAVQKPPAELLFN